MRAAEGGQEVIECIVVREIGNRHLRAPFIPVAFKKIVHPHRNVKEMPSSNALRVVIVILRSWRRYLGQSGA